MISRRFLIGVAAAAPVAGFAVKPSDLTIVEDRKFSLAAQYFAALISSGLMTANEARAQIRRPGGPDWPSMPVSVRL